MPTFQFRCPDCKTREDRQIFFEEIPSQRCDSCGQPVVYEFVPTRSKPQVYANDSIHPSQFTGPKQRARYLAQNNLIELGDESLATVKKEHARWQAEADESFSHEIENTVQSALEELGDAGLYTSEPASHNPHHNLPDDDHTGAGVQDGH